MKKEKRILSFITARNPSQNKGLEIPLIKSIAELESINKRTLSSILFDL
jgi:hypothetical protein